MEVINPELLKRDRLTEMTDNQAQARKRQAGEPAELVGVAVAGVGDPVAGEGDELAPPADVEQLDAGTGQPQHLVVDVQRCEVC
jgi:hypothetical protein